MFQSLSIKIFLSMAALVVFCVGGSATITAIQGNGIAIDEVTDSLYQSRRIQETAAATRFQNLLLLNQLISSDPYFGSHIGQAAGTDLGFGEAESVDTASIVDLINERNETLQFQYGIGFDFAYVIDPDGYLLATTAQNPIGTEDFTTDAVLALMIEDLETVTGYWSKNAHIYQIAGVPLASDDELVGFLVLGLEAEDEYVAEIKDTSHTEYAIFSPAVEGYEPITGSLSETAHQNLAAWLSSESAVHGKPFEIELDDQNWMAISGNLSDNADETVGVSVSLVSLDEALVGFVELRNLLLAVALVSVLLTVGVAYFLSVRTVRPLKELGEAAQAAARGDYRAEIGTGTGQDEMSSLRQSLTSLLSDLREKSDMEEFMKSLSRLQPESEEEEALSAARRIDSKPEEHNATLLAFELKDLIDSSLPADELAAQMERANKFVNLVIKRYGGTVVDSSGYRCFAYFKGKESLKSALSAIPEAVSHLSVQKIRPVMALTRGKITTAAIRLEGIMRETSVGKPWLILERLLSEATPGYVFITKNTTLALVAQEIDLEAEKLPGILTKKPFHALSLTSIGLSKTLIELEPETKTDTVTNLESLGVVNLEDIKPGMVINDRYEIISQIGVGGMGIVYKTYDRELDDVVALKLLSMGLDKKLVGLMKTETRLARKVTDPNILRTYDFGDVDGLPYLSMEYVRGLTLSYVLENTGALPFSAAVQISKQLCTALLAAHAEGIAHRDVKPANLMLDYTGRIKLMDFGLAGTNNGVRAIGGTPRYASPEQLLGLDAKTSGDIYSCGVVLYELFTGELPFQLEGSNLKELAKKQRAQTPKPAISINETLPELLNDMIMRCINQRPEERPTDINEVLEVLETVKA